MARWRRVLHVVLNASFEKAMSVVKTIIWVDNKSRFCVISNSSTVLGYNMLLGKRPINNMNFI